MKYLALLILTLFITAPHPAQAAATCATTECLCTLEGSEWYSNTYVAADAAACLAHCDSFVTTATGYWRFSCTDSGGADVAARAGQGTIVQIDNVDTGDGVVLINARNPVIPILNVPIPGLDFGDTVTYDEEGNLQANFLAKYIDALYRFMIVAMSIVAVVMMMIGGLQYILARGHADAVKKAKERMANSVIGVILLLAAYNIAFLINPDTVRFESLKIETIPLQPYIAESFEDLESYGTAPIVDEAGVITIPKDAKNSHIINWAGDDARMAQTVYDALKAAALKFYNSTLAEGKGLNIAVNSASRTVAQQVNMFVPRCLATGYCSKSIAVCNPDKTKTVVTYDKSTKKYTKTAAYVNKTDAEITAALIVNAKAENCMHTNNIAVDVWPEGSGKDFVFDVALMNKMTTALYESGFCRIPNESWHFELMPASSMCSNTRFTTSDYTLDGGKTTKSTAGCKTWDGAAHCCKTPVTQSDPPLATLCKSTATK